MAMVLVPISVWFWLAPPTFLGPTPIPEISFERREAGIKAEMVLLVKRIEAWSGEHFGRLPVNLAETGQEHVDIRYLRLTATTYRLRAEIDTATIDFDSTEDLDEFFASARMVIDRGGN